MRAHPQGKDSGARTTFSLSVTRTASGTCGARASASESDCAVGARGRWGEGERAQSGGVVEARR